MPNFNPYFNPFDVAGSAEQAGKTMSKMGRKEKFNQFFNSDIMKGVGAVGAAAPQIIEGIGAISDLHQQQQGVVDQFNDMEFTNAETMVNGVPSYSGVSAIGQELGAIDSDAATRGMGMKGFSGGAAAGASIGGAIGAGVGAVGGAGIAALPLGAIGTGVGALAGGIGGWIGGMTKKGKAAKAAYKAQQKGMRKFNAAQGEYNEDVGEYYDQVDTQRQQAQGERSYAQRQYGLNQYSDPFRSIV